MIQENNKNILVIGDLVIDEHIWCETERISPEAPVPVCLYKSSETILGGAGNVAKQCAMVTSSVCMTVVPRTLDEKIIKLLNQNNIFSYWLTVEDFKIPYKKRIWSNGQQICRLDHEEENRNFQNLQDIGLQRIKNRIIEIIMGQDINVVLLIDYDKGALTDKLINSIAEYCKAFNILTILDPKRPSFCNLKNIDIIKPNRIEINNTNLTDLQVSKKLKDTYLIITEGKKGMKILKGGKLLGNVGGHSVEVSDACGAGDIVCAVLGLTLNKNTLDYKSIHYSCKYASLAASKVVQHRGNYALSKEEFENIRAIIK